MNSCAIISPDDLKNRSVTVMGLGRFGGGLAVVRYLVKHGAVVTVTDQATSESLEDSLQQIADLPIHNVFCGGHPEEAFADCEILVVNPAVKPDHPVLNRCEAAGIPVFTEIQLLLMHLSAATSDDCPPPSDSQQPGSSESRPPQHATIVAVTGSNGKSTTSALIHHLLSFEFEQKHALWGGSQSDGTQSDGTMADDAPVSELPVRKCWLGGNIGNSLLPVVDEIQPNDVVVLELSSFQLHYLKNVPFAPDVAVLTGFSANHLDWHSNLADYQAAKQNLFRRQSRFQTSIVPASHQIEGQPGFFADDDDDLQPTWRVRGRLLQFGTTDDGQDGAFWEEDTLVVRNAGKDDSGIEDAVRLSVPGCLAGDHNLQNLTAAACAAMRCGADPILFPKSLPGFRGLPFRIAMAGQKGSIRWINDSASTTPESTIAAVHTFHRQLNRGTGQHTGRLVVIVGGSHKGSDVAPLVSTLNQLADGVVAIGDVAENLADLLNRRSDDRPVPVSVARDLPDAFSRAVELVASEGIVLFSPGFSSFGWFQNYVDRGQQCDLLVKQWIQK